MKAKKFKSAKDNGWISVSEVIKLGLQKVRRVTVSDGNLAFIGFVDDKELTAAVNCGKAVPSMFLDEVLQEIVAIESEGCDLAFLWVTENYYEESKASGVRACAYKTISALKNDSTHIDTTIELACLQSALL